MHVIRWPAFIIGIGILILSLIPPKFPPLPTLPEDLTLQQVVELVYEKANHYVKFEGVPDMGKRIFSTPCRYPIYSLRDTGEKYQLSQTDLSADDEIKSYLGTVVQLQCRLSGSYVSMETKSDKKDTADNLLNQRILVALDGTDNKIWAISKVFKKGESDSSDAWLRQSTIEGTLTLLSDIDENVGGYPKLEFGYRELKDFIKNEFNVLVPNDAFLVITDYEWNYKPYSHAPIKGSDCKLFLGMYDGEDSKINGTITAVFEPWPTKVYNSFHRLLGVEQPATIGILTLESAEDYNHRKAMNKKGMQMTGGFLSIVAGLFIAYKKIRKK